MFKLIKKQKNKRFGELKTKSGEIQTPFFMPIATKGVVRNLTPEDLEILGAQIVLGNTYHLWLRPGYKLIAKLGGLHRFMNWSKPILTDSGGFQVFSLGAKAEKKYGKNGVKLTEKGVYFSDPSDGKKYFMSPEKSIEIQLNLGSDIIMVLDECPPYPCSRKEVEKAVERTTNWARRCKEYFENNYKEKCQKTDKSNDLPLLFAIVQGGVYQDLRERSVKELLKIGFDGYAIGGVAVGEPREKMKEVLNWVLPLLPENKARYLMGLGKPEEIIEAVNLGIDMFDCVIPTREGRHGRLFVKRDNWQEIIEKSFSEEKDNLLINFYDTINIANEKFKEDEFSVDKNCNCYLCQNYSKAYLRHLFKIKDPLALRLSTIHNLSFYLELMKQIRK